MTARFPARHALIAMAGLFMLGLVGVAAAEPPAPSPASLLIAKKIVEIKGVGGLFEPIVREEVEKARIALIQTNFTWTKDINDSAAVVYKSYGPRANEFVDAIARIYASHFSEAELNGLLTFYQSPLGRKMLTEEPKALSESATYAKKWGEEISGDAMSKMRAEMKKRGHNL